MHTARASAQKKEEDRKTCTHIHTVFASAQKKNTKANHRPAVVLHFQKFFFKKKVTATQLKKFLIFIGFLFFFLNFLGGGPISEFWAWVLYTPFNKEFNSLIQYNNGLCRMIVFKNISWTHMLTKIPGSGRDFADSIFFAGPKKHVLSDVSKQHSKIIPAADAIRSNHRFGRTWCARGENGA